MVRFFFIFLIVTLSWDLSAQQKTASLTWMTTESFGQFKHGKPDPNQNTGVNFALRENLLPWIALGGEVSFFRIGSKGYQNSFGSSFNGGFGQGVVYIHEKSTVLSLETTLLFSKGLKKTKSAMRLGVQPSVGLASVGFRQILESSYTSNQGFQFESTDYYTFRNQVVPLWGIQFPCSAALGNQVEFFLSLKLQSALTDFDDLSLTDKAENPLAAVPSIWDSFIAAKREQLGKMNRFGVISILIGVQYRWEE